MKRAFVKSAAAFLAAVLAMQALPAGAVYQNSEEIAFSLRGIETEGCCYLADANTVYIAETAAAAGTSVRIGMYIEAEYADLAYLYAKLQSDTPGITFNADSFVYPNNSRYAAEAITYTTEDNRSFSTTFKPYALGKLTSKKVNGETVYSYHHDCGGVETNFDPEKNAFNLTWMYGYSDLVNMTAGFLGSRSDEFSFIDIELDIAPDTKPGTYYVSFVSNTENSDYGETYLTSDDSIGGASDYNHIIPTLKNLEIVVAPNGDANLDGEVNAEDAAKVLVYAAKKGSGGSPVLYSADDPAKERLAYFLADVNENSTTCGEGDGTALNATDASAILRYAAAAGSGKDADWSDILRKS